MSLSGIRKSLRRELQRFLVGVKSGRKSLKKQLVSIFQKRQEVQERSYADLREKHEKLQNHFDLLQQANQSLVKNINMLQKKLYESVNHGSRKPAQQRQFDPKKRKKKRMTFKKKFMDRQGEGRAKDIQRNKSSINLQSQNKKY